jgi:hypothetical protein
MRIPLRLLVLWALLSAPFVPLTCAQSFTKITSGAIVSDGASSHGCIWGDYNNDGFPDLFVCVRGNNNLLYRNNGNGTFTKITTGSIVNDGGDSASAAWGDYDNDGYLDLYVSNRTSQNNFLYHNNGDGTFTRVLSSALVADALTTDGPAWGDYDNDGWLDLFVAGETGVGNSLFHNNGDGTFTKITFGAIATDSGNSRGAAWGDYDNDGYLDLFVSNIQLPSFLYHNNGNGTFTRITVGSIVNNLADSHGCAWGDYNNDGYLDLFVGNDNAQNNFLYRNNGDGTFTQITSGAIVTDGGGSREISWGDYDNDGWLDLFVANGASGNDFLYHNNGNGTFTKITTGPVVTDGLSAYGCAWEDYDNDGSLDLFVANHVGQNDLLYHNDGGSNRWLKVKCIGVASNRGGIGARVTIIHSTGGSLLTQIRDITSGDGFGSQHGLIAKFGVGQSDRVSKVIVRWPGGTVQVFKEVAVNQTLVVREGITGTTKPRLTGPHFANPTTFQFTVIGEAGLTYAIQATATFPDWQTIGTISLTNLAGTFSDQPPVPPLRFYRAVSP